MAYDLEEQEQLAEIKAWWKQYGNQLLCMLIAAAVLIAIWQGWTLYQHRQTEQASVLYGVLKNAILQQETPQIQTASGELLEKFGNTTYATMGALISARALMNTDAPTAKARALWAVEHGKDEWRDLARLLAAPLLLDEKAYEQALAQLNGASSPFFDVRFQDMRGDILAAQGKPTEAVESYRLALDRLKTQGTSTDAGSDALFRELVGQKIDALGGAR